MKKILIGLAALVVLVIVILVAAPFFIPVETYKQQIAERTRDATGRELAIKGDFRLSLLPRLELEANDVTFANAPWAREPNMVTLDQLLIQLQIWPLLSGEVKVDSFVLVEPVIHLEIDENGRVNWDFAGEPAEPGEVTEKEVEAEEVLLRELSLGDVRLERGRVTYRDARSGDVFEASDINMAVSLPDLDSPFSAEGTLVWNGATLDLAAGSGKLRDLMAGRATPVRLALKSELVNLVYDGSVTNAEPARIDGRIDIDVPSVRELAAWTGNPIEGGSGLGLLRIEGKIAGTPTSFAFTEAAISLDEMNATGDLSADLGEAKPYLSGRLDVDRIDLNAYLPPDAGASPEEAKAEAAPAAEGPAGWSDEPIELDGLKAANADFALSVGAIQVREIKIGKTALTTSLKDGLLTLDLTELALYGGSGTGRLNLDGRGDIPVVENAFKLSGVQAGPLLTDAAGFDRLEGTGRMEISITTRGRSEKALVEAMNGNGTVKFIDGAITGINLAGMVRNLQGAFLDAGARAPEKTDFAELSGSFRIERGILRNDDLLLLNPLLRLTGAGTANLPQRTLNYRIEPNVVATLEGQTGEAEMAGVKVPVIIEGPWSNLTYRPDLEGLVEEMIKDPEKVIEGVTGAIEQLEGTPTDGLRQLLPGAPAEAAAEGEAAPAPLPDVSKTLKGLFGD